MTMGDKIQNKAQEVGGKAKEKVGEAGSAGNEQRQDPDFVRAGLSRAPPEPLTSLKETDQHVGISVRTAASVNAVRGRRTPAQLATRQARHPDRGP